MVTITRVLYDAAGYDEREVHAVEDSFPAPDEKRTLWINVDGVHEVTVLERFGRRFGLHPLLLEDIAHTEQRPKLESYGDHLFMDLNVFHLHEGSDEIHGEQISLVLGGNWLLSFNEGPQAWARPLRERLKADKAHCRQHGGRTTWPTRSSTPSWTTTTTCSSASATASRTSRRS